MPHYNIYVVSGIPSEVVVHDWLKNMGSSSDPRPAGDIGDDRSRLDGAATDAARSLAYTRLRQEVARRERTELALQQSQKMEQSAA